MKNKLSDLNDHLFAEMERLSDEDLIGEELDTELKRAHAITNVAAQIVNNANLVLKAQIAKGNYDAQEFHVPAMLESGKNDA